MMSRDRAARESVPAFRTGGALPDGVRLRSMEQQDLATVAEAEASLFGAEAWSPALLRAELAAASGPTADRRYVVVERVAEDACAGTPRGHLLGYAGLWFGDGAGDADLLTVATLPVARRRGIATVMIDHLLRRAQQAGCTAVVLEVRSSNAGAQALYRRHGFVPVGMRRRYYFAPIEDALVMRLDIGPRRGAGSAGAAGPARPTGPVGAETTGAAPADAAG